MFLFLAVALQVVHDITDNIEYWYIFEKFCTKFYSNSLERNGQFHTHVLCFSNFAHSTEQPDFTDKTMQTMVGKNTFDISNNLFIKFHNPLDHLPVDENILRFRNCIIFRQYKLQGA
jgi:hypothetical protein